MAEESKVPAQNQGHGGKSTEHPEPENTASNAAGGGAIDPAGRGAVSAQTEAPSDPAAAAGELVSLADAATKGRLSPAEEDRATADMRVCLANGAEGIASAFAAMAKLPWILGVRAIEQSWPSLPEDARAALLARLSEERAGDFIRLRLSVARSLTKIDPPVGVQVAVSVCKSIWVAGEGVLTPVDSKLIGNVFIGRGKPWVLQLPLDGLPDEDADAVVSCVAFSAFNVNNPPVTQLSVLRYAGARLARLHANLLGFIARSVGRWSGKWQKALRSEVPELPETITAALNQGRDAGQEKSGSRENAADAPADDDDEGEAEVPLPPELEEKLKLATETGDPETIESVTEEVNAWRAAQRVAATEDSARASRDDRSSRGRRGRGGRDRGRDEGDGKKERPAYVSREQEAVAKSGGQFNLQTALRQIENHVQQLRNELGTMQAKLRKAESSGRRATGSASAGTDLSPEEMKRMVLQFEQRNGDLQARVEELLADSEARALATASDSDITAQYRTLLKLKLQDDYADYLSLELGEPDVIVQQHYRALVRHVFATLRGEGIALEGDLPPPPPAPMPPPPPPPDVDDEEEDDEELDRIEEPGAEESVDDDADDQADDVPAGDEVPEDRADDEDSAGEHPEDAESAQDEPRK